MGVVIAVALAVVSGAGASLLSGFFGFFAVKFAEIFEAVAGIFFFGAVGGKFLLFEFYLRGGFFGLEFVVRFLSFGVLCPVAEVGVAGVDEGVGAFGLAAGIGEFLLPFFGGFDGFFDFFFDGFAGAGVDHAGVGDDLGGEIVRSFGDA